MAYYKGYSLLKRLDENGKSPVLYITEGNRESGKTYFWKRWLINRSKNGQQFMLILRNVGDMQNFSLDFFKDTHNTTGWNITKGDDYRRIERLEGMSNVTLGFVTSLKKNSKLRNSAAIFGNVKYFYFDEFQDEFGEYVSEEYKRLMSIHSTVARGNNTNVKIILSSNSIGLKNPFYDELGLMDKIKLKTTKLCGDGWVWERYINKKAQAKYIQKSLKGEYANFASGASNLSAERWFVKRKKVDLKSLKVSMLVKNELYELHNTKSGLFILPGNNVSNGVYAIRPEDVNDGIPMALPLKHILETSLLSGKLSFDKKSTQHEIVSCLSAWKLKGII